MITYSHVGKQFGGRPVLTDLNYTFEPDTVYVVRGGSGSGKSTLLNLAAGYLAPDEGSVKAPDVVGYLMQDELLFSKLTVLDNLRIRSVGLPGGSPADVEDRIGAALDRLHIAPLRGATVADLSGGERRRVEIAGLLLGDPPLILLDEPTANLDPENSASVYAALWDVQPGRTVLIVTHEPHIPSLPSGAVRLVLNGGKLDEAL